MLPLMGVGLLDEVVFFRGELKGDTHLEVARDAGVRNEALMVMVFFGIRDIRAFADQKRSRDRGLRSRFQ